MEFTEFQPYAGRTHEKMREVLMHPDATGPAVHYYMIRGGKQKRNITVWEAGTIGGEYIKTYGHYHIGQLDETYWVVQGEGVILQQKMAVVDGKSLEDVIEEFKVIRVKAGDSIYMPPEYGHLGINTGQEWFVTTDDSPVAEAGDSASMPGHADYSAIQRMHGFAYYVVEQNGSPALAKNPLYKEVRHSDFGGLPIAL